MLRFYISMTADIVFYDEAASRESLVAEAKGGVALTSSARYSEKCG